MARRDSILVSRSLYQLGVITLITSLTWVAIGIYLAVNKSSVSEVDKELLEPINLSIDQAALETLSGRLKIDTTIVELMTPPPEASVSAIEEVIAPPPESSVSASIETGGTQ